MKNYPKLNAILNDLNYALEEIEFLTIHPRATNVRERAQGIQALLGGAITIVEGY